MPALKKILLPFVVCRCLFQYISDAWVDKNNPVAIIRDPGINRQNCKSDESDEIDDWTIGTEKKPV